MKELLEIIAKGIVDSPQEVVVEETSANGLISIKLHVAKGDMGKVIGKQGKIAYAIRSVAKAKAAKDNVKVVVEIV